LVIQYGLIADIHANHIALKIALEQLQDAGVDHILCSGDIVGYGGAPNEVIQLLRKYKVQSILGNHDFYFMVEMKQQGIESILPLIPEIIEAHSKMKLTKIAVKMINWQLKRVNPINRKWLGKLPVTLSPDNEHIFLVHGAPPLSTSTFTGARINFDDYFYCLMYYLFPRDTDSLAVSCEIQPFPITIIGHTHVQFAHQSYNISSPPLNTFHPFLLRYKEDFPASSTFLGKVPVIINPGSVGQSRDKIKAPGFAVLSIYGEKMRVVTWYRFKYPFEEYEAYLHKKNTPPEIISKNFWNYSDQI
jgi:predicted phosphodiesterase